MALKTRTLAFMLLILLQVVLVEAKYTPQQIQDFKALVQTRLDKY